MPVKKKMVAFLSYLKLIGLVPSSLSIYKNAKVMSTLFSD